MTGVVPGAGVTGWEFMLRDLEAARLAELLGAPTRPTVMVSGEAGVGKSRLTEYALGRYVAGGGCGRRCVGSSSLADVPFGALVGLIPGHHMAAVAAGTQQLSVFAMVLEYVQQAGASSTRPFVVLVDDLQHLDDASCGLLVQLVAHAPVQVMATFRSGEPLPDGALPLWSASNVAPLVLAAFDRSAVDEIIRRTLGEVTPEVREALWEQSRGNALYLRELVVGSVGSGRIALHGDTWVLAKPLVGSAQLAEYLLQRTRRLPADARRLADMLALCQPLALAVFRPDELAALDRLLVSGIAAAAGDPDARDVRLSHPIYADVLRAQLSPVAARSVLADVVARMEAHRQPADDLRMTVWQLDMGGVPPVDELVRAAFGAMAARDLLLAARLTRAAQAQAPHHPMASLVLSDALYEMGDFTGSAAEATGALGVATDPVEQGMLVASLYRAYLWGLDDADGALAVIDFALAVTPPGEAHLQLVVAAANALSFSDRPAAALGRLSVLDRGDALAAEAALFAPVEQATLTQLGRTADAIAERVPEGAPALHQVVRSFSLAEHGCFDEAASLGQNLRTDVIGLALALDQMWAALNAGRAHLLAGRPRSALVWAGDAMIIAERAGLIAGQSLIVSVLAAAHAQLGDAAAVAAVDQRAAELAHVRGFLRAERAVGRAWAAFMRGEHTLARQLLEAGAQQAREAGQVVSESFLLHELLRLGGAPSAARLAELAAVAQSPLVASRAALAAGAVAADAAVCAAAGEQFTAMGANLAAAEAFQMAAGFARRAGRAATSYANRADHLRRQCEGAVTPLLSSTAVAELQGLSKREREIAALAAKGHSAKEIAQLLFVSVRTVENHLHRVYGKLGVSNRVELARYFPAR